MRRASGAVSSMPVYEYYCDKCQWEVTLPLSTSEHEKGKIECPKCGGKALRPLQSTGGSETPMCVESPSALVVSSDRKGH